MKLLKEREGLKHVTYITRRSTVAIPRTTDECRSTTIKDVHCTTHLFIEQRENKEVVYTE
jgi:hypothetical protein